MINGSALVLKSDVVDLNPTIQISDSHHGFITTQLLDNITQIFFVLIKNYFSSILRCEDDMIFAHPLCMC